MKGRVLVKEYLCSVLSLTQRVVMLLHLPFILQHDDVILLTIDLLRNRLPDPALKPPSMEAPSAFCPSRKSFMILVSVSENLAFLGLGA